MVLTLLKDICLTWEGKKKTWKLRHSKPRRRYEKDKEGSPMELSFIDSNIKKVTILTIIANLCSQMCVFPAFTPWPPVCHVGSSEVIWDHPVLPRQPSPEGWDQEVTRKVCCSTQLTFMWSVVHQKQAQLTTLYETLVAWCTGHLKTVSTTF